MPFALTWMPDILLRAGLKVATVDGWENRGRREVEKTLGIICHHTAGRRHGNMPALRTLIDGRADLPGPLAQLGLGRDGTYYVIAAGQANHAGKGNWNGITSGNGSFIGIEAENTGRSDDSPWPPVQMDAYRRGVAALLFHLGLRESACAGHKEYALPRGRKSDPDFDMHEFRRDVAAILDGRGEQPILIPALEPTGTGAVARPTLRRGVRSDLVSTLQKLLGLTGAEARGSAREQNNDDFDAKTEAAVRAFQRVHGLVPDGIVGPKSWQALDALAPAADVRA